MKILVLFLFLASGMSGLIYEITWTRIFTLLFGNTTYAISTVLTAFMAGLAGGSFIFGRIADKFKINFQFSRPTIVGAPNFQFSIPNSPLMLYAILELCIGISALSVPPSLNALDNFYISVLGNTPPSAFSSNMIRFLISFFILFVPTTLMGGTLPVLSRYFIHKIEELGWNIGVLYAVNTLGAVIGCFMTGYMLIAAIGMKNTTLLAVFINIAVGVVAMILALKIGISPSNQESVEGGQGVKGSRGQGKKGLKPLNPRTLEPLNPSLLLFFFGLSGFTSLSYEILWTRAFSLTFYSTVYLFSNILTVFLIGIAIGSLVFTKLLKWRQDMDMVRFFGIIEFLIGVCALLSIIFFQWLPFGMNSISSLFDEMTWQKNILITFIINLFVMFIPTLLMGLTFPLIGRLYTDNLDLLGRKIGNVYSVNTIGSIVGSFLAGFFLIPFFGVQKSILLVSFINLLIGVVIIYRSPTGINGLKWPGLTSAVIILFAFGKIATADVNMGVGYRISGNIIFSKEDVSGTVKVVEDEGGSFRTLMVNNYSLATSGDVAVRFGHIPLLLHNKPEDILIISLGSGITVGAVGQHPVKNIECVEIVPGVVDAAGFFERENHDILKDPRLRLTIWDGRNYVLMTKNKYDVLISDLFQPDSAGTGNLYSKEHYQNSRDRLKNGGLMAQWLPLYQLSTEDLKVIMATFSKVFPHVTVWYGDINSVKPTLLLLGSESPLKIDIEHLQEKMRQEGVVSDIIEKDNPFAFMSFFIMDEKGVSKFIEGAVLNTDNKPFIEFSAPKYIWGRSESAVQNFSELSKFRELPASILSTQHSALITYFKGRGHIINGRIHHAKGLFDKEIEEYRIAEMENPFDPYLGFAYFELGYEYYTKGMFKDAVSVFERGKAVNRDLKELQFYLAKSYYNLGMQREYEEILRENPEFVKQ